MVPRFLSAALVLVFVPLTVRAGDAKENPFKKAKVGDWVSYKTIASFGGNELEGSTKQTVSAKDDDTVTLKITGKFGDKEIPAQEVKVDLTKPFNPQSLFSMGKKNPKAKVEKAGEGKEELKVGGKTYDCKWSKSKITTEFMGNEMTSDLKVWTATNVPLAGMVKMEIKSDKGGFTLELTGSGNGG
jgi:hypothetical protein